MTYKADYEGCQSLVLCRGDEKHVTISAYGAD